jgi:ATP-binding protein involved in chromosome partitioning
MQEEKPVCETCSSATCSAKAKRGGETDEEFKERQELARRLCGIEHKILVLSGKGGVGKSSVAASLAVALARRGKKVGILDIDIHGPSIPRLLGVEGAHATGTEHSIDPVVTSAGISVMSMGFLLKDRDDAVIWRGPLKYAMIKQFLKDVEWGRLDYLIIDSPPGTGDEPLSIAQLIDDADGAVIITTPQALSLSDVRKSIGFVRRLNVPALGVIENMSGYECPGCGTRMDLFGTGGGAAMARDLGVPFLGSVPIDPLFVPACDAGALETYLAAGGHGAEALLSVVDELVSHIEGPVPAVDVQTGGDAGGPRESDADLDTARGDDS